MILKATTYDENIKSLYSLLQTLSGIDKTRIKNKDSVRGVDLKQIIDNTYSTDIDYKNCFMLFEIDEDKNENNYFTTDNDYKKSAIVNYDLNVSLYGYSSHQLAQTILARLKDDTILNDIREKGVYIIGIDSPTSVKEFINNTLWHRVDFTIKYIVRYIVEPVVDDGYANNLGTIKINQ